MSVFCEHGWPGTGCVECKTEREAASARASDPELRKKLRVASNCESSIVDARILMAAASTRIEKMEDENATLREKLAEAEFANVTAVRDGWKAAHDCVSWTWANTLDARYSKDYFAGYNDAVSIMQNEIANGEPTEWLGCQWRKQLEFDAQVAALRVQKDAALARVGAAIEKGAEGFRTIAIRRIESETDRLLEQDYMLDSDAIIEDLRALPLPRVVEYVDGNMDGAIVEKIIRDWRETDVAAESKQHGCKPWRTISKVSTGIYFTADKAGHFTCKPENGVKRIPGPAPE